MLAVLLGFVFLVAGGVGIFIWKGDFLIALKGLIPFLFLVGGGISVVAGITSIAESFEPKTNGENESREKK